MGLFTKLITSLIIILVTTKTYCQESSNKSLFIGSSFMTASIKSGHSFGRHLTIGYQNDFFNKRFRIEPALSFATYTSRFVTDVPSVYYTTSNLKCNFVVDALKIKAFSMIVGLGVLGNFTSGYNGGGGWTDYPYKDTGYFYQSNLALNALIGFRLNPSSKKFAYEFLLAEGAKRFKREYGEVSIFQFRLIYKL